MSDSDEPYADELPELFSTAIGLDDSARADMLASLRTLRPALAARLAELIAADRDASAFLARPFAAPGISTIVSVGDVVDGFRIEARIASGANGTVFRATQDYPRRTVALKVLHFALPSAGALARFRYEVRLLAQLSHPGIVSVFAAGVIEPDGRALPWFAMELVDEACDIRAYLRDQSIDRRVATLAEVCDAIHHAHLKQIIHRDLKPGNILIGSDARPRVIDFGVATSIGSAATFASNLGALTPEGAVIGTLAYMSPEQLEPSGDVDARTDIYALGVILYELCTGKLPYRLGGSPAQAMRAITLDSPIDPVHAAPSVRALRGDLAAIILKAIDRTPSKRYSSAPEFAADLRHFLAREPVVARRPRMVERMIRAARRRPVVTTAITLTVCGALGITITSVIGAATAYREAMRAQSYINRLITAFEHHTILNMGREARVADAADSMVLLVDGTTIDAGADADARMIAARMYEAIGLYSEAFVQYRKAHDLRTRAFGATSVAALEANSSIARALATAQSVNGSASISMEAAECKVVVADAFQSLVDALGWRDARTIDAISWSAPMLATQSLRDCLSTLESASLSAELDANLRCTVLKELAIRGELKPDDADATFLTATRDLVHRAVDSGDGEILLPAASFARELARNGDMRAAKEFAEQVLARCLEANLSSDHNGVRRWLAHTMRELQELDRALELLRLVRETSDRATISGRLQSYAAATDSMRLLCELDTVETACTIGASALSAEDQLDADPIIRPWRAIATACYAKTLALAGQPERARAAIVEARALATPSLRLNVKARETLEGELAEAAQRLSKLSPTLKRNSSSPER